MKIQLPVLVLVLASVLVFCGATSGADPSAKQLANWLKRFPAADTNKDGKLSVQEANNFRRKMQEGSAQRSAKTSFKVDSGWDAERFPEFAVAYRTPAEIAAIYEKTLRSNQSAVTSYPKPEDGSLRIVGTGHSFMMPGYQTFPLIARAAGLGPEYYSCWIDFCLKYNPKMKFYLSDAWPQLDQLDEIPTTEAELTSELFVRLGKEKHATYEALIGSLNKKYPGKVFVLPTSDAMVLAVQAYHRGELPGVEGVHKYVGKKERSLWRDRLGHLGPGFGNLEGYVFYAMMYGRSPELIDGDVRFKGQSDFPSRELDRVFRKIAWQAVIGNPLSGHADKNGDGISDGGE